MLTSRQLALLLFSSLLFLLILDWLFGFVYLVWWDDKGFRDLKSCAYTCVGSWLLIPLFTGVPFILLIMGGLISLGFVLYLLSNSRKNSSQTEEQTTLLG